MKFDFKKPEQVSETILNKKTIVSKITQFNFLSQGFNMKFNQIPAGVWSVMTLILGVIAMHYKVTNAVWILPIGCLLYFASKHTVPFAVMLVALAGMASGIPQVALLLIFSIITMIKWQ